MAKHIEVNIVYGRNPDPFYGPGTSFYLDIVFDEFNYIFLPINENEHGWNADGTTDTNYDDSLAHHGFMKIELFKWEP